MPRRLRVAFPGGSPQAPRVLTAEYGRYTLTGRAATLAKTIPIVADDEWLPLFTSATIGASPAMNNAWVAGCVIKTTGEWFFGHQQVGGGQPRGGAWFFNPVTATWRMTNTNQTQWWKSIGFRENYDCVYDQDRDSVWIGTGGPVDWGGAPGSPVYGNIRYDIATDTFYNAYPAADCTYTPTTDATYFLTANKGLGLACFDHKWLYAGGYLFTLGGWSVGSSQAFRKLDPTTNTATTLTSYGAGLPPMSKDDGRYTTVRAALDSRSNRFYLMADDGAIYTYDNVASAATRTWSRLTTTGTAPSVTTPLGETGTTNGVVIAIDEASNHLVAWCSAGGVIDKSNNQQKTWLLDLSTLAWRDGPSAAGGDTVPPGSACAVQQSMDYDPVGKRVLLALSPQATYTTQIWSFRGGSTHPGKITSFKLPALSGTVYGANYYGFPFTEQQGCKHVNMAYCPSDGRLYATGGDSIGSATDGIWSMNINDGSWRIDFGRPSYPTVTAPFAYQDNEGFSWDANRGKLIFWPGSGAYGYGPPNMDPPNSPYAEGLWWFDPVAKTWEQDKTMFYGYTITWGATSSTVASSGLYSRTGMLHGGIYDSQTDIIYASTGTSGMSRYNVGTMTRMSAASLVGYPGTPIAGYTGVYWSETKWEQVGRWIFIPTALRNGAGDSRFALAKWNIDSGAFVWCANPPMPGDGTGTGTFKEQRIGVSNGKIIWPKTEGPVGDIFNIYVYDISADTWQVDTQRPGYGRFYCNAVASIPDGRVVLGGSNVNGYQTHIWFYEAF